MNNFNKDTDIREYRKQVIVRLSSQGLTQESIASAVDCSQGLVSQVLSTYEELGEEGLRTKPRKGRVPLMSDSEEADLDKRLRKGSKAFGFPTDG